MILAHAGGLRGFAHDFCRALGAPERAAAETARHLVLSNLSGHDSHGVIRIPLYLAMTESGALQPANEPEVISETPVSVLVDAHRSLGQHSTFFTLERCLEKAARSGLAIGSIRHSTHTGRVGTYPEAAAAEGFACIATTGSAGTEYGLVAPFGGSRRFLSTNPWSIGIPAGRDRFPFLYDAATSTIAEGKNMVAKTKGVSVPEGTLLDAAGRPTTDPEQLYQGGTLTPLGGAAAGHKGYGFSLAAALLGAMGMIGDPEPSPAGTLRDFDGASGVMLIVIDPALFGDAETYRGLVDRTLDEAKATPTAPGFAEVLYAGEPEARMRAVREREGIPIPEALWAELEAIAARLGINPPPAIS